MGNGMGRQIGMVLGGCWEGRGGDLDHETYLPGSHPQCVHHRLGALSSVVCLGCGRRGVPPLLKEIRRRGWGGGAPFFGKRRRGGGAPTHPSWGR